MIVVREQAVDDLVTGIVGIGHKVEWLPDIDHHEQGDHFIEQGAFVAIGPHQTFVNSVKRLSIDESVQRIHEDYSEFPLDLIEDKIIGWLEMEFAPESYSRQQLDELDRLPRSGSMTTMAGVRCGESL